MKRSWKLLVLGAMLTVGMTVSAAAASFTSSADALSDMGLFSGTGSGYELDREPTRAEAAVMLVRLLGGEKEATENQYDTPFTDVPQWASPYVGWLYGNDLTAGESATIYGTNSKCTAQMYSAFLLRSLGYADSGDTPDFKYADAIDFATEKGVADAVNYDADNFLRDHVVAMSYTALSVQPKDGKHDTLLDQLITSDSIDAAKAAKTKSTFAAYREYVALSEKQAKTDKMAMTMKMAMAAKQNGVEMMSADMNMNVKANMDMEKLDHSKFSMDGKMTMKLAEGMVEAGEDSAMTTDMSAYYTDGIYYIKTGDEKIKMPMSFDAMIESMDMMDMLYNTAEPITMFESIEKTSTGGYKVRYAPDFMNGMVEDVLGSLGLDASASVDMKLKKFDIEVAVKNDQISTMKANVDAAATVAGETIEMIMAIDYVITATGNGVVVTLPKDLDTYTEMPGLSGL